MADRGFHIRHPLLPRGATLNMPSFTHGKPLSKKAVARSRKIATVRIHVERAIRRMKTFRILSGIIPIRLRFQLDQIITVVCVLCNLQKKLAWEYVMNIKLMTILIKCQQIIMYVKDGKRWQYSQILWSFYSFWVG
jgi:hypothetical protein